MSNDDLRTEYRSVLSKLSSDYKWTVEDKFSGVFLPTAFPAYKDTTPKILFVGRETSGWNTDNKKNTMQRIITANENGSLNSIIDEAIQRYSWHLKDKADGKVKTKETSHLKRYYLKVANELGLKPEAMIYSNLLSWDYDKGAPLKLPNKDREKIIELSIELMSIQIKEFKPDYIIFATGVTGDSVIKKLFESHFGGYSTERVLPKKMWQFNAANATCFRIAHPRYQNGHAEFRQAVIDVIKSDAKIQPGN
ncbi:MULTISPECIES: hypothetical protein [unclassified Neptuniibacter]|uniref:hypothetical protein n=1 Tax=unclassified Neptuniibacter TaxID=2630693 RepID=UPI000C54539E|nr:MULTISPECIES: hypothetical protein [unclassified Neptuniibacter]MAY41899.1 hypothetical protein [Oceanospirillaceae bacterium]|tara:strand:- start:124 stop:876 length:753 start_codon:yes stop_codon:yes gene_type:complete